MGGALPHRVPQKPLRKRSAYPTNIRIESYLGLQIRTIFMTLWWLVGSAKSFHLLAPMVSYSLFIHLFFDAVT